MHPEVVLTNRFAYSIIMRPNRRRLYISPVAQGRLYLLKKTVGITKCMCIYIYIYIYI